MNYKEKIDPELRKNARSIPYNRFITSAGNIYQTVSWRSAKVPESIDETDIEMKGYQGLSLKTTVFSPKGADEKKPALIYVHGGAFVYKAAAYQKKLVCIYAEKTGCKVFFPHYHLAPKYQYPAAFRDVMSLYEYVTTNAEKLGIDNRRIGIAGDSAGASIAALICNRYAEEHLNVPCLQMLVYPATDAEMATDSMKQFSDTPQWNSRANGRMWHYYCGDDMAKRISASPVHCEMPDLIPKTYIETAEFDCLHDEGIMYAQKLIDAGAEVVINETAGTYHGYDTVTDAKIVMQNVERRIEFLRNGFGCI